MKIKIIENEQDFLLIKQDWDRLAENLIPVNKFNWIYKWWQYNKDNNELKVLAAYKDNRIVGIAPLYIHNLRTFKVLTLKKLCFLGGIVSDYLDFLIEQDQSRELIFESLLNFAVDNLKFDAAELRQVNSDYPNFDLWQKYAEQLNIKSKLYCKCPKTRLSKFKSYEDYFSQLSKNHKKSIKLRSNKIRKENDSVEFEFKRDITPEDIKTIANINIRRQQFLLEKGDHSRFCFFTSNNDGRFIKDYFCNGDPDSKMLINLKCNGIVISYILALRTKNTLFYWNTAFDPDYEIFSPTKLLINEAMKYAFDNGYEYFDFMRGPDPYKLDWANEISENHNLRKYKTIKGRMGYLYRDIFPEFLLPKRLRASSVKDQLDAGYQY